MARPKLLDLFCKAGGAGEGYHRAGFDVVGVDIQPQPRNPHTFHQADALEFIREYGHTFDAIHASPPCQDFTPLAGLSGVRGTGWLLPATRGALIRSGKPWVIENVPGAPMRADIVLCGEAFGLRTVRHRLFESSIPLVGMPHPLGSAHPGRHLRPSSIKKRKREFAQGYNFSINGNVGRWVGPPCMGIDWMNGAELSQAVPPAYTQHIGAQLLAFLARDRLEPTSRGDQPSPPCRYPFTQHTCYNTA